MNELHEGLGWGWGGGSCQCYLFDSLAHTLEALEAGVRLVSRFFFDSHAHCVDCFGAEVRSGINCGWVGGLYQLLLLIPMLFGSNPPTIL